MINIYSRACITGSKIILVSIFLLLIAAQNTFSASSAKQQCFDTDNDNNIQYCREAISKDKNNRKLHVVLGKSLEKKNAFDDARFAYNAALKLFPNDKFFLKRLSIVESYIEERDWLAKKKAEKQGNKNQASQLKIAAIKCKKLSGQKAIKNCDTVLALSPNQPEIILAKANHLYSQKQYLQAKKTYQELSSYAGFEAIAQARLKQFNTQPAAELNIAQRKTESNQVAKVSEQKVTPALKPAVVTESPFTAELSQPKLSKSAAQTANTINQEKPVILTGQKRYALVVGNSDYKASPLKNPVNDAKDMASKLEEYGFEVKKLFDASLREMETEITQFGKKLYGENTVGLFYYAGHGLQIDGQNYLVPVDANIETEADVKYESVNAGRILSQMELAENGLNMVILDACRNNPYTRSWRSSARGLAKMEAPAGSLMLYATSPGKVAADGEGRNGLFTEKLMANIDKKGLKIEDVFKQTAIAVSQFSNKKQIPYIEGVILGDFYFHGDGKPEPVKKIVSVDSSIEIERDFWKAVNQSPSIEMYEAYLQEYPDGYYAKIAAIKIKLLKNQSR
jgi:hypothetical protein